jgi:hypothetical protein
MRRAHACHLGKVGHGEVLPYMLADERQHARHAPAINRSSRKALQAQESFGLAIKGELACRSPCTHRKMPLRAQDNSSIRNAG